MAEAKRELLISPGKLFRKACGSQTRAHSGVTAALGIHLADEQRLVLLVRGPPFGILRLKHRRSGQHQQHRLFVPGKIVPDAVERLCRSAATQAEPQRLGFRAARESQAETGGRLFFC